MSWLNEPQLQEPWDLLVVTSMVDLASLKSFQPQLSATPVLLYMHENQFAYPDSGDQHGSIDPQMVNLYSAVVADRVVFNSEWNRQSFLAGGTALLAKMPDAVPGGLMASLAEKSVVLPVPIDDRLYVRRGQALNFKTPHLLWNHRWEYDKSPDRLYLLLNGLREAGQAFRLSVVGEQFRNQPREFQTIQAAFKDELVHWGFLSTRSEYDQLLQSADVVISTAVHDFQGLSMIEAMASGCLALAPDRLAYPEYVPENQRYRSFKDHPEAEAGAAVDTLIRLMAQRATTSPPDLWRLSRLREEYQGVLMGLLSRHQQTGGTE